MRIVIDMQGAQTESRFRGIGRYTLSFAQAIVRNRGEHEIILALSCLFPDTIEPIRAAFDGLLSQENIRVWHAPGPVHEGHPDNDARREVAELIREAFLASLKPDLIHISSLFEGYVDDAVTSIGRFDRATLVSVSLYDLIPLLNPDHYLDPNPRYAQYYRRKVEHLRRAAIDLAISEFTRQEGLAHLDAPASRIVNVATAIEPCFCPLRIDDATAAQLRQKFGLSRPFILYTGGADERKNLPRLIQAYAALPAPLRAGHQLLLAGKISQGDLTRLQHLAKSAGLKPAELCFTGYVTDEELIALYNLCQLFVFPSWHEGFGLPALEAMACGAPVIGANTSSLPEVIDLEVALFDPLDVNSIATKMSQALKDEAFRATLRDHGLQQAKRFSWNESAKRAIAAWESLQKSKPQQNPANQTIGRKPRLAFVSPLPPERTGIADYSAELLPALAAHYDIEIVVAQDRVDTPWANDQNDKVRDVTWLRAHADEIDRVVYQIGNSPFHQHMLPLLREIPGTVVLHDFYLSGLMAWLEMVAGADHTWAEALYAAHGYGAVRERYRDAEVAKRQYPVNLHVLQHAQGLIVHSEYSRKLAQQWYGSGFAAASVVIPLLRSPAGPLDKAAARKQLGIDGDDFVVCSFGFLDSTKLNHRLLGSWLSSALAGDKQCNLVFVGENNGGDYGSSLLQTIRSSGRGNRIRITGFASPEMFRQYLVAADVAVQLRTHSRGETSAAVLDCMNYSLPLIVNANGSMAEIPSDAVWVLPDKFENYELTEALESLWKNDEHRFSLGMRAKEVIVASHAPTACATQYAEAIERFHARAQSGTTALVNAIADIEGFSPTADECLALAQSIADSLPITKASSQLLIDVSATCRNDLKTGIQRVVRALVQQLVLAPPLGYRVEPVYLTDQGGQWHYRYARDWTSRSLGLSGTFLLDDPVDYSAGDLMLIADYTGGYAVAAERAGVFEKLKISGISIHFVVYDLLPIQMPHVFPPNSFGYVEWLQALYRVADGALCISQSVAAELSAWAENSSPPRTRPIKIDWFHLGADIESTIPTKGFQIGSDKILKIIAAVPSFLMVGTIEPRKGYLQTIDAFTQLWQKGFDINLVIVGNEGWRDLPDDMRRTIPEIVERLRTHPELGKRLLWLSGISDEYLEHVYAASGCLIAASEGEGFGLPLIEAAQHKLPIIARDIPVFREVAGEHAYYFSGLAPKDLADAITVWRALNQGGMHPKSVGMPYLSWRESALQLKNVLFDRKKNQLGTQFD